MSQAYSLREERLRQHTQAQRRGRGDHAEDVRYRDRSRERTRHNGRRDGYHQYTARDDSRSRRSKGDIYVPPPPSDQPAPPPIKKEKPNFEPSGLLAKESNNIEGIQLKYTEPKDGSAPPTDTNYQLYSFPKGATIPKIHDLTTRHYYIIGRDSKVAQILTDHETCSKQHAVIQFRARPTTDTLGKTTTQIKPYIIDLESSNGTFINNEEIPTSRFIELKPEDVIRFGDSTTDNVLIIS